MTVEQYNAALLDEKFKNDRARIKNHEDHMKEQDAEIKDLRELTVEIAALTKQNEARLGQHEERLSSIEKSRPALWTRSHPPRFQQSWLLLWAFCSNDERSDLMKAIRADFPTDWPRCNLYVLADLHIGDPHCVPSEVTRRIEEIKNDPYGLCILNGDLMNTALRNSVSDVYGEVMKPMQQITFLVDLLRPITGKIIGATTGNHENRVYKADGIDTMRIVCRELGFEDKYCPEGVLIFLRFGTRAAGTQHMKEGRNPRQWYSIYATHGSGGGRKEGAKAIRLADMASIVDADIYIHSHTHLPMVMKEDFFRSDSSNCAVHKISKLFVNTSATLTYGGYGQSYEFKPPSIHSPVVHLEAKHKRATATL